MDLIICRCEEVTRADIKAAVESGARTAHEVKMKTRAGMGVCQGRTCRALVEELVGEDFVFSEEQPSTLRYHTPVRPVYLAQLVVKTHADSD